MDDKGNHNDHSYVKDENIHNPKEKYGHLYFIDYPIYIYIYK